MRNKKGAEGGQAVAVLLLVIGLFIVLYILLLSPEERQNIIGGDGGTSDGTGVTETILSESPGLIEPAVDETTKHDINSVNLFVKSQPKIDFLADSLVIKRGWFSKYFPKIKFDIENLDKLNKAGLYFRVAGPTKGVLRVWINGAEIYSETITDQDLKIIEVPVSLLTRKNEIRFSVDVPLTFWNPNSYTLEDVSFKEEYNLVNKQESRAFSLSVEEKDRIKSSELSYFMYCNELDGNSANLKISLNKREIFSGNVPCVGTRESVEIDTVYLRKGANELLFEIDKGDFSFNDMFVKTDYRGANYPIYYFNLGEENYEDIKDETVDAVLELKFEAGGEKRARLLVNDNDITMISSSDSFSRNIDDMLDQGSNFIKVIPLNTFSVDSLKIVLK